MLTTVHADVRNYHLRLFGTRNKNRGYSLIGYNSTGGAASNVSSGDLPGTGNPMVIPHR